MKKPNENGVAVRIETNHLSPEDRRKLINLLDKSKADNPKPADMNELRQMLEESPAIWSSVSELANMSMQAIMNGNWIDPTLRAFIEGGQVGIKRDLGYPDAPALEKMLIEHIVICWLELQKTQLIFESKSRVPHDLAVGDYWQRRLTASQIRFLRASETLARVRRLSRPGALQVNIAARQLNLAQTGQTGGTDPEDKFKSLDVDQLEPPKS